MHLLYSISNYHAKVLFVFDIMVSVLVSYDLLVLECFVLAVSCSSGPRLLLILGAISVVLV